MKTAGVIVVEHMPVVVASLALLLSIVTVGVGAILKTSLANVAQQVLAAKLELGEKINDLQREIDVRIESKERAMGEVAAALREKIRELELYTRDEFIRRGSFEVAHSEMKEMIRLLTAKVDHLTIRFERELRGGPPTAL